MLDRDTCIFNEYNKANGFNVYVRNFCIVYLLTKLLHVNFPIIINC